MMETMIPPQVGMRLRMEKREAKEAQIKKEAKEAHQKKKKEKKKKIKKWEKKREGAMLLSFFHTSASK